MPVTLSEIAQWLEVYDVRLDIADNQSVVGDVGRATVDLRRSRSHLRAKMLYGSHITLSHALDRLDHNPTVIATSTLSPRTARAFRQAGLQYIDSAGNASLKFDDVVIDVQGRRGKAAPTPAADAPINMFTPSRAKVVCVLLTWPSLRNAPRREVARVAGVSVGQAHQTLRTLTELGYDHGEDDPPRLLDLWTAAFPTGLARRLFIDSFQGPVDGAIETDRPVYVSGERAFDELLRPGSQVLYVSEFDVTLPLRNRWRKDAHPNVTVRTAFWQDPFAECTEPLVRTAPWPLVYADLATSHDARARDAAAAWRARHVRP